MPRRHDFEKSQAGGADLLRQYAEAPSMAEILRPERSVDIHVDSERTKCKARAARCIITTLPADQGVMKPTVAVETDAGFLQSRFPEGSGPPGGQPGERAVEVHADSGFSCRPDHFLELRAQQRLPARQYDLAASFALELRDEPADCIQG